MDANLGAISTKAHPKRVLLAPLDWGLGHATRCIPIIHQLLQHGHEVWLAGEGPVQALLQAEFPALSFLPLRGYRVRYGRSAAGTTLLLLLQAPSMLRSICREQRWLQQTMQSFHFDIVISDNRYGLYHPDAYCVFLTHQLQIKAPTPFLKKWLRHLNYRYINRFNACWIPDHKEQGSLAGKLSHPKQTPAIPVCYTGPLSRFAAQASAPAGGHLLILLSGPEPQRSMLEKKLLLQAAAINTPVHLVRGLPKEKTLPEVPAHITVHNHLSALELQKTMSQAALVVCRSGYSTVMDLAALGKKSILIPTPGQTEQQYLARHLEQQGFAPWSRQERFNLQEALAVAATFSYRLPRAAEHSLLTDALSGLYTALKAKAENTGKAGDR